MIKQFFRSVYNKVTGKDVQKIQNDIIDSYQRELTECREYTDRLTQELEDTKRQLRNKDLNESILQGRVNELSQIRQGLELDIRNLRNQPERVVEQFVMTQGVYDKFVRSMEPPVVTNNTTAQGAGYLVGMQRVLEKLREQFVSR